MHIPNGFIDPHMSFGFLGAAALVLGFCISKAREAITQVVPERALAAAGNVVATIGEKGKRVLSDFGKKKIIVMSMSAALIFALQMLDFPVLDGASGHFLGGVFAAVLLGPFAGTIVMAAVITIQAIFFGDGGIFAIGVNIINMAVIASLCSYYIYDILRKTIPTSVSIAIASYLSVIGASVAYSLEIGLPTLQILKIYSLIGIAEAAITLLLLEICNSLLKNNNQIV